MARNFVSASTQYLEYGVALLTTLSGTIAGWIYPTAAVNQTIWGIFRNTTTAEFINMTWRSTGAIRVSINSSAATLNVTTTATGALNTWHHAATTLEGGSSRTIYLNGGNSVNDTTAKTDPVAMNRTAIARNSFSTPNQYFDGRVAEFGVWNVALSANEIAALALGVSPRDIRPNALVGYAPILGLHDPELDLTSNNRTLTVSGATFANHAPVAMFSRSLYVPSLWEIEPQTVRREQRGTWHGAWLGPTNYTLGVT